MAEHLHPADPIYQGLQLSSLRFQLENGREPTREEKLGLAQARFGCSVDEADAILTASDRTGELEKMARDILDEALPTMFGGAFAHMARRP